MMSDAPNISVLYKRAVSQQERGNFDKAIDTYSQVLRLKPDCIEALCNMGAAFHAKGGYRQAADCYRKLLEFKPDLPQFHFNLGAALHAMDELEAAEASYARALALEPRYLQAHFNVGLVNMSRQRFLAALEHFRTALAIQPRLPDLHNQLGVCLLKLGSRSEALAHFRQALTLDPDHFESLGNLSVELLGMEQLAGAFTCAERALSLRPQEPKALYNFGAVLKAQKRFKEAAACFQKVLEKDPDAVHARLDLAHCLQTMCDWTDRRFSLEATGSFIKRVIDDDDSVRVDLFNSLSLPLSSEVLLRVARRAAKNIEGSVAHLSHIKRLPVDFVPMDHSRLRIGYLSPKFRDHPGAHLMGGLFKAHDRDRFEVFAYSVGPDDGSVYRQRIEKEAEHFVDLYTSSLEQCVECIRRHRIQVLVDLAGYTTGARPEVLALRAAPIQVNYLGFPGTLGAEWYDYLITDRVVTPPEEQSRYSEAFAYLPNCYQVNDDRELPAPQGPDRAACGLPERAFVFCCFNNNYKIEPRIFDAWSSILTQVRGSVLWLLQGSPEQSQNLRREVSRRGIDPERLVFANPLEKSVHLARHQHADLFLDTLYYNAHTTGSDALRMGVPMVTTPGKTFASRVGASLLHAVGLNDMVAPSLDDYVALAVALGREPARLQSVRERLMGNLRRCSLFDNASSARQLERLYQAMWASFSKATPPNKIIP